MFYAYVIQSEIDKSFYKGHCENLKLRLEQHNAGQTKSIKNKVHFKIVYFEEFSSRPKAIKREKYFKSAAGRKYIKSKLYLL
jgi:putative endonuclease